MNSSCPPRCVGDHPPVKPTVPRRQSARLAGKPTDNVCIPNYTKPGVDAIWKAAHEKDNPSVFGKELVHSSELEHQSLEVPRLDQPHSAPSGSPHPISSPELGVGFEASSHPYRHGTRVPNSKDGFERTKNDRLDLPAPQDKKRWSELDGTLAVVRPGRFTSAWIHSTPSSKLATVFDDFLYEFFKENCGLVEPPPVSPPNSGRAKHKGLEKLRRRKQAGTS